MVNFNSFINFDFYKQLLDLLNNGETNIYISGVSNIHKAHLSNSLCESLKCPVLIITSDDTETQKLSEDINSLYKDEVSICFYSRDFNFMDVEGISKDYDQSRIATLHEIVSGNKKIVVSSVQAMLQRTMPKRVFLDSILRLEKNQEIDYKSVLSFLSLAGYTKRDIVDGHHQFSVRGDILDVFVSGFKNPVRIEFFGDVIESISFFDIETQRRSEHLQEITILPSVEVVCKDKDDFINKLEHFKKLAFENKKFTYLVDKQIDEIKSGIFLENIDKFLPLCYKDNETILDYMKDSVVVISESFDVFQASENFLSEHNDDVKNLIENNIIVDGIGHFTISITEFLENLSNKKCIIMDIFTRSNKYLNPNHLVSLSATSLNHIGSNLNDLKEDILDYLRNDYCIIIYAGTEKAAKTLQSDLFSMSIECIYSENVFKFFYKKVFITSGAISSGFLYPETKFCVMSVPKFRSTNAVKKKKGGISNLDDLKIGDLVVHVSHGIGRYEGVGAVEVEGVIKDYIKIKYRGSDVVYIPVINMDLISRYVSSKEDDKVKLSKLKSIEWQKTKQKAFDSTKDMAKELIEIYSKRAREKGYAFSKDTSLQKDFEDHFPFVETDDQLKAVKEIKIDMEKQNPMDRLLCGDVGFGKTEVAIRAAFKCVADGKQCAILAPTTILANQHYQNIVKRMDNFSVSVELLSRFRTPKQQVDIIKKLNAGKIDIIVGTHRIVQKDVLFKNLGLAIIDEEQRFGVAHKERFKELFPHVDVLTLSATPIPRTLNMAINGIRDMSLIEQPPIDKQPIQTYVAEYDENIVLNAIKKEKRRGGQVYYVHNRVDTIDSVAVNIMNMLPNISVEVAHGRMTENQIFNVWKKLVNGEIDVLVCTTIIETGVDVSNCNTLIVEDADNMGLAQLYQLRGRIGRGGRRAYCYLLFKPLKVLTEVASKRLLAIKEFANFGSGYKIALRDMEIRGAGNILSKSQHGHIDSVGYDMYIKLLNQAISEQKGEKIKSIIETVIDVNVDTHIPESYITDSSSRLDIYKKIAKIRTQEDKEDLIEELKDRFSKPPKTIKTLIDISLIRNKASSYNISEIKQRGKKLFFYIAFIDFEKLNKIMDEFVKNYGNKNVYLNLKGKSYISFIVDNQKNILSEIHCILNIFYLLDN